MRVFYNHRSACGHSAVTSTHSVLIGETSGVCDGISFVFGVGNESPLSPTWKYLCCSERIGYILMKLEERNSALFNWDVRFEYLFIDRMK